MIEQSAYERPCIAVIDSDPMIRTLIAEVLLQEGLQPALWDGIEETLTYIERVKPAAIVLDLRVGHTVGAENTLNSLLDFQTAADVPVILCSADVIFLNAHTGALATAGFQILTKPFDLDALVDCVRWAIDESSVLAPATGSGTAASAPR